MADDFDSGCHLVVVEESTGLVQGDESGTARYGHFHGADATLWAERCVNVINSVRIQGRYPRELAKCEPLSWVGFA